LIPHISHPISISLLILITPYTMCDVVVIYLGSLQVSSESLQSPTIKGYTFCICITQEDYETGLDNCKKNLHGSHVLSKGDKPYMTTDLKGILSDKSTTFSPWCRVTLNLNLQHMRIFVLFGQWEW